MAGPIKHVGDPDEVKRIAILIPGASSSTMLRRDVRLLKASRGIGDVVGDFVRDPESHCNNRLRDDAM
jgi:hypothetical protein